MRAQAVFTAPTHAAQRVQLASATNPPACFRVSNPRRMSGISFPGHEETSDSEYNFASASGTGNGFPAQNGFQVGSTSGGASSGFQMNPLSSHPPRTPRTSVISSSTYVYGASVYEDAPSHAMAEKVEVKEEVYDPADEPDDDDAETAAASKRVRREDVWREMIITSDGRDKAFVRNAFIPCIVRALKFVVQPAETHPIHDTHVSTVPQSHCEANAMEDTMGEETG